MTALSSTSNVDPEHQRWGLPDALVGWIVANISAGLLGVLLVSAFGYSTDSESLKNLPITMVALQFPPLWIGFIGVPVLVAAVKGTGWIRDFRVRFRLRDVPVGLASGVAAQLILVPLLSLPILWLTNTDMDKLSEPARQLGDKADSPLGVFLLFAAVAVGAPIAEEIFFRGLLLRSFEKRFGTAVAVVASSVVFGATHFQALQFAALTGAGLVFALLTVRYDRLGPAIFAHMAFNGLTVASLVGWL
ncbi:MAG: type II CAAX endopeptidase family protein [Aquihabitans sp.]